MSLIKRFEEAKAQRDLLKKQLAEKTARLESVEKSIEHHEQAKWVLNEVVKQTQLNFKEQVEALVTMAIGSVFDRPFEFKLEFNEKPSKMEIQPLIVEGENEYIPKLEMGGGIIELVSVAFRIVLWSLSDPQPRNTIILDEPVRMLGSLAERFAEFLTQISGELGLQVILITHEEELMYIGNKSWNVSHDGTKSKVTVSKGGQR